MPVYTVDNSMSCAQSRIKDITRDGMELVFSPAWAGSHAHPATLNGATDTRRLRQFGILAPLSNRKEEAG